VLGAILSYRPDMDDPAGGLGPEAPRLEGVDTARNRRRRLTATLVVVAALVGLAALAVGNLPAGGPATAGAMVTPSAASAAADAGTSTPSFHSSSSPGSASPSSPMAAGRVAVVDGGDTLRTFDAAGGTASATAPGASLGFPAWSPDGTRIADVAQSGDGSAVDVFSVTPAGLAGRATTIYQSPNELPFYLYWTPDSRRVSFLTTEGAGLALRVVPADAAAPLSGHDTRSVLRRGAPLYLDWVGAERVLLHVGAGASAFTGQVGLDGAAFGPPVGGTGAFRAASLSRDGRWVAYASAPRGAVGQIVVARADGSARDTIPAYGPAAMLFDPAGDILATIAADAPAAPAVDLPFGPLRLVDPASGAVRTLLPHSVLAFFWAPDGRTIAALRLVAAGSTPVAAGGSVTQADARVAAAASPSASPPAAPTVELDFVDVATGAIRAARPVDLGDAFVSELLPYFDQYALSHRLWSPDGTALVLPLVSSNGDTVVTVIPADGTDPRPIATGIAGFWSP
jgi:TolB protein